MLVDGEGAPLRLVGALDHDAAAMADELAKAGNIGARSPAGVQRVVQAVKQVGRGVDQRAVEIENDDWACSWVSRN